MLRFEISGLTIAALLVTACSRGPERAPAIGVAYAGPVSVTLHADVDLKSAVVATVHHGDRLEIVGRRRSTWYKVRTASGAEGWTGDRDLLDAGQMQRLKLLAEESKDLPSQGAASSFSALNVHTEANRQSASFVQIREKEKFQTLAHRVAPRVPLPKRQLIPPAPKVEKDPNKKRGKEDKNAAVPPPPAPEAPGLPPDWLQLSGREPGAENDSAPIDKPQAAPPAMDDWTLIRTATGEVGWVLTSAVYLEIPDEVAQYAEGRRITSYFSIGRIKDADEEKDIWLWTTSEKLGEDHDFDSYRVFTWSTRRHRYETAYIQRRERGYFPVQAKNGEFSVCLEKKDGSLARKKYVLLNTTVRPAGETPCRVTLTGQPENDPAQHLTDVPAPADTPGLRERITAAIGRLRGLKPGKK